MTEKTKTISPYGSWLSPLTAKDVAESGVRFGHLQASEHGLYWTETRPSESANNRLMRYNSSQNETLTDADYSVRSRVHEMGGAEFFASEDLVFFSNDSDAKIYQLRDGKCEPLLSEQTDEEQRFCDFHYHTELKLLVAVRERHSDSTVINEIVAVSLKDDTPAINVITSGFDFYSFPRVSPDGKQMFWTCWSHPQMPWDGTELWLADIDDGKLINQRKLAGGPKESIYQPLWGKEGEIFFISDRDNWSNIYRIKDGKTKQITQLENDFGLPQWIFATSTYGLNEDAIITRYQDYDRQYLCKIDLSSFKLTKLTTETTYFGEYLQVQGNKVYYFGSNPSEETSLIEFDLTSNTEKVIRRGSQSALDEGFISQPKAIECDSDGMKVFGFYYPPTNADFEAPKDSLPPLLVLSHGGPTAATHPSFNKAILYWTTRGFAVLDVNYRGSTGYGRSYREALNGQWGIADVQDCIALTQYLVNKDKVDAKKLAIRGGSAGGFTTLCALTFHDTYAVGMSRYGIGDLELLATDTHKFEARYLDSLVGDYKKNKELYQARSPIHHLSELSCPVLLLQGLKDKIVPPSQSEAMVAAMEKNKLAYGYVTFENEGHGFRHSENIIRALEAEYYFYSKILDFELAETIEPITINNLSE